MRAIRFDGEFLRVVTDAPDPVLLPGEALVHPVRLLISPADALAASHEGFRDRLVGVPGHQFVGVVKKIGAIDEGVGPQAALAKARAGLLNKRVVGSPAIACTNCDMCRAGLPGHCRARRVMGLHARDGCFADLFAIPLSVLAPVPDGMEDDLAVFAHLASSAAQTRRMMHGAGKHYVTVIGDSALALITARVLARDNKSTRLLYTRPDRARICERWGLKHRSIEEPGRRQDQDVVVDCSGTPTGLRLALQMVRPRGTVLLKSPAAGLPYPPGPTWPRASAAWAEGVDLTPAVVNEVQILGCREASITDGLGTLADADIDAAALITKRFRLDDAVAAYAAAGSGEHVAVVMDA